MTAVLLSQLWQGTMGHWLRGVAIAAVTPLGGTQDEAQVVFQDPGLIRSTVSIWDWAITP